MKIEYVPFIIVAFILLYKFVKGFIQGLKELRKSKHGKS